MIDIPRDPELQDKVFTDENGEKYNGQRFIMSADDAFFDGYSKTEVWYKDGKIHGTIVYSDGLEEQWENGKYVKTLYLPFCQRG